MLFSCSRISRNSARKSGITVWKKKAKRLKFPDALLRVILFGYGCQRRIAYKGVVSDPAFPKAGVVVGDAFATTVVKIHYLEASLNFRVRREKWFGKEV